MALGGFVLGSLILYLKGMRIMMFQLSGFYCKALKPFLLHSLTLEAQTLLQSRVQTLLHLQRP